MKCLILAGGKGNSLWPLSREEYPKQFMQIKKNRSLLQETVARNIPFCDEFLITTNASCHFIVEGQMQAFQELKYRCILEEEGRKTAPAIALTCMYLNPSELVFVVSADQIIEGSEYKETIMRGRALAKEGKLVTFGMEVKSPHTGYGYILHEKERVLEFREKPDPETAQRYFEHGGYFWNSGNFLFRAGDFLNELRKYAPAVHQACLAARRKVRMDGSVVRLDRELMETIPAISVEKAVFEHSDCVSVVKASFYWRDIGNLEILTDYMKREEGHNVISENCENVTVLNQSERQLVVANDIRDVTIVNTEDACYITGQTGGTAIKQIMQHHPEYGMYFEKSGMVYRPWGVYEILSYTSNYKVKRVRVYPGKSLTTHRHALRSEQWSVVQGTATVTLDGEERELPLYSSIEVPVGVNHRLSNRADDDLIIVEVSFGPQITEEDKEGVIEAEPGTNICEEFIRCEPVFKDYLWGGTKLRDIYGKKCDYDTIAESWELSAHEDGQCRVASGKHKGMFFREYLEMIGEDALGWKCQAFEKFPLLIKFIDAKKQLSVQVHPDDSYALSQENEYGKNEMWYIMDCDPGAAIYFGLKKEVSPEELKKRALDHSITEILNEVKVKKGDTFFVEAGTIHAIGGGILLCEVQQNSNCTYRLYDYGRKDKFGNLRRLQLDRAVAVADRSAVHETAETAADGEPAAGRDIKTAAERNPSIGKSAETASDGTSSEKAGTEAAGTGRPRGSEQYPLLKQEGYQLQKLCECKYFTSVRYDVEKSAQIAADEASFSSIVILEGNGEIQVGDRNMKFRAADSFFVHAGKKTIQVKGCCSFILTRL